MRTLAEDEKTSHYWRYLGLMGIAAGFLILSFYSVVAGWTMAYVFRVAGGMFVGATADEVTGMFGDFVADPERLLAWHTLFMVMTAVVVSRGVKSGLEQAVRFLMPALFVLLIAMVGYAMNTGHFNEALAYLFTPDFSKISGDTVLAALGQAFFSLSLGMGAIMIYGSYLPHNASIGRTTVTIAAMDTMVALVAGLAIFPIVFANGLQPELGSGMVFKVLPIAFGQMDAGSLFGTLFFLLLVFAAWTSAISLLEPVVTWLVENHDMTRVKATAWGGLAAWLFGVASLLSLNLWSDYTLFGMAFIDLVEYVAANVMLPLGGLLVAVFAAWVMSKQSSQDELHTARWVYALWRVLTRYLAPVAVTVILLNATGILKLIQERLFI